jgi:predicted secreted protein
VTDSDIGADGYHFTLSCHGDPDGELEGRLQLGDDAATLNVTGWTGTAQENVPVVITATGISTSGLDSFGIWIIDTNPKITIAAISK